MMNQPITKLKFGDVEWWPIEDLEFEEALDDDALFQKVVPVGHRAPKKLHGLEVGIRKVDQVVVMVRRKQ
jgi:hypothetical protein